MADSLRRYRAKRDFKLTSEPAEGGQSNDDAPAFVIQKHWASRLHYDLRLELDGVMKSWAVPKGPSFDPKDKRMAVQVEDHPIAYNQFEGDIPKGQYGAGKVVIWDEGTWTPLQDARKGYRDGMLKFDMHGVKMKGHWVLVRMKGRSEKQPPWLLIKEKDEYARSAGDFSVVDEMPDSVVPQRTAAKKAAARKSGGKAAAQAVVDDAGGKKAASKNAVSKKAADKRTVGKKAAGESKSAGKLRRLPGQDAALPTSFKPQLATLVDGVPSDVQDWLFEIKFDGYRLLARIEGDSVRLFTRNGHDWTHKLEHLARAVGKLKLPSGWLDGEIVVLNDKGAPSFQALQNAFDSERTAAIVYYVFDAPFLAGRDLRQEPLELRRDLLGQLLGAHPPAGLRFSEMFDVPPRDLIASACRMGLEGVIGKRRNASYVNRRADTWIKLKCTQRQEFVIAGYTDPKGGRSGFGSLLLAVRDDSGALRYAGNVGTGFDGAMLGEIKKRLDALATAKSPLDGKTDLDRSAHWVKPRLVAEVSFGQWTTTGRIRHSVFHGLRADKSAGAITREKAVPAKAIAMKAGKTAGAKTAKGASRPADETPKSSLRVTHPERVIDPSTGLTKLDLVRFYALVSPLLIEHLKGRPVSLVRAPSGITGELFFQKHLESKMPGVKELDPSLDPDHPPYIEVPTPQAVVAATQMNVVEFHTWNAVKSSIGKPDRMTFDLDPGANVKWPSMQQAAQLVHAFLSQIGLESFLKTSGGKGLHIVVPLKKQYDWDTIKDFSQAIVQHLASTLPQLFVAKSGPKNRVGKIFVDYLRNGFGATTAAAWSARARPGLGVSVPVEWDEIESIKSGDQWNVSNIHARLDKGNAPWEGDSAQGAAGAMKALDFKPKKIR